MRRRDFVAAMAAAAWPLAAGAQPLEYPNRTVRIVIGGIGSDKIFDVTLEKIGTNWFVTFLDPSRRH